MSTSQDIVRAATTVARDAAEGKLDPLSLDAMLVAELRQLFGDVVGEGDALWPLQLDVARQVLALGGISADELAEWAAALRYRDAEPSSAPDAVDETSELRSTGSVELSAENDALDAIADAVIEHESHDTALDAVADDETQLDAEQGCGCSDTGPTSMTTLADGRRVPSHRIVGRGPSIL